jgi:hypothetical protein
MAKDKAGDNSKLPIRYRVSIPSLTSGEPSMKGVVVCIVASRCQINQSSYRDDFPNRQRLLETIRELEPSSVNALTTSQLILLGVSEIIALVVIVWIWMKRRHRRLALRLIWSVVLLMQCLDFWLTFSSGRILTSTRTTLIRYRDLPSIPGDARGHD